MTRIIIISVGLLAALGGWVPAHAGLSCDLGVREVQQALEHARLDDYTKRQVDEAFAQIAKAKVDNNDVACEDLVMQLKHILHLDH